METGTGVNALTIVFAALCIFAIAYRFYGLFIATKVLSLNEARKTPAVKYSDGQDYVPTNKYVLFGHHFAAIAAAGPLLGPVLAAQFGYMPGLLWILIGCVLAGGVHDMVVLFCSVRHRGRSLAYIATQEIDRTTGFVASWAVLAILILTLAGLSIAVVNAMHNSLWSTYTVAATIPIAILMGLYMQIWRKGDVVGATVIGVVLLFLCILSGPWVAAHPEYFGWLDIDRKAMSILIPIYGFFSAAFFPEHAALVMIGLYVFGILMGVVSALILGKTAFHGRPVPFVMELPNYRFPSVKSVALLLWEKAKDFLQRAFSVIFLATIAIWFLQSFDARLNVVASSSDSLLAMIGRLVAPIFAPLGFADWRCATALISGFIAKESVVSTLQILLGGAGVTTLLSTTAAVSFLVFTLLYTPCVAAIAAIRREVGSGARAAMICVSQCCVAWLCAFVVFTILRIV